MKKVKRLSALRLEEILAEERTIWANEQTTLAYIRTGFSALLLGIGLAGLIRITGTSPWLVYGGILSLVLGVIFIVLGLIYYPLRTKMIKTIA